MKELAGLSSLIELNLGEGVTDAGLKELAKMPQLERLGFGGSNSKITDAGIKELAKLPKLKSLFISAKVSDAGLKDIAGFKNLSDVWLTFTPMTPKSLRELKRLGKLSSLMLGFRDMTDESLQRICDLQMVHVLSTAEAEVPEDAPFPQRPPRAKSEMEVATLSLADEPLTDAGIQKLAGLKNLTNLNLERTNVTDAGVARLQKALRKCNILH